MQAVIITWLYMLVRVIISLTSMLKTSSSISNYCNGLISGDNASFCGLSLPTRNAEINARNKCRNCNCDCQSLIGHSVIGKFGEVLVIIISPQNSVTFAKLIWHNLCYIKYVMKLNGSSQTVRGRYVSLCLFLIPW